MGGAREKSSTGAEQDQGRRQFLRTCGLGLLHFVVLGGFCEPVEAACEDCAQKPESDDCKPSESADVCKRGGELCNVDHNEADKCECATSDVKGENQLDICNCPKDTADGETILADVCKCTDPEQLVDYCQCTGDQAASVDDYCDCGKELKGDECWAYQTDLNVETDKCTVGHDDPENGLYAAADMCRCDSDEGVADVCDTGKEGNDPGQSADWCLCDADTGVADVCTCGPDQGVSDNCVSAISDYCECGKDSTQADVQYKDDNATCQHTEANPDWCPRQGIKDLDVCTCGTDRGVQDLCEPAPPDHNPPENRDECDCGKEEGQPLADQCQCQWDAAQTVDKCTCGDDANQSDYCACCPDPNAGDVCTCKADLSPKGHKGRDPRDMQDWCRVGFSEAGGHDYCKCGAEVPTVCGWAVDQCTCSRGDKHYDDFCECTGDKNVADLCTCTEGDFGEQANDNCLCDGDKNVVDVCMCKYDEWGTDVP